MFYLDEWDFIIHRSSLADSMTKESVGVRVVGGLFVANCIVKAAKGNRPSLKASRSSEGN